MTDINFETTGGVMAVRKRRLQTYTVGVNPFTGRFLVTDDWHENRIAGSGFLTADDAVEAFRRLDARRTGNLDLRNARTLP